MTTDEQLAQELRNAMQQAAELAASLNKRGWEVSLGFNDEKGKFIGRAYIVRTEKL